MFVGAVFCIKSVSIIYNSLNLKFRWCKLAYFYIKVDALLVLGTRTKETCISYFNWHRYILITSFRLLFFERAHFWCNLIANGRVLHDSSKLTLVLLLLLLCKHNIKHY